MEVVEKMKKATKRLLAAFLALAMVFTLLAVPATSMKDVSAATSKTVYITRIVTELFPISRIV